MEYDSEDTDDDDIPLLQDLDHLELSKEIKYDNTNTNNSTDTQSQNKVPVTILTGFLGSGKTTLVKHILTSNQHNYKIAVIENEYGGGENNAQLAERLGLTVNDISTLSVETMIAKDGTDGSNLADFIELPNGCVCCTVKDSLVETLENLLSKRTDLDYVIIEASGMADPGPVASIFWLDGALDSRIQLDGIVCCIDSKNIINQLKDTSSSSAEHDGGGDEAARQIAFADRIIINKVDLLQQQQQNNNIESVLQQIKSINPTAPTKQTTYSNIEDINWILNAECFDAERVKDVESAFQQSSTETSDYASPLFLATLNQHQHTNAVGTIALFGRGSVDLQKMNAWLATLLWPDQDEKDSILRARLEADLASGNTAPHIPIDSKKKKQQIYRMKGILSVVHSIDKDTRKVIPSSNDFVDEGLAAGLVCSENGLDERRFIVQAVNDLWDTLPSQNLHWSTSDTRCCKIVVIGKWLNEEQLQKGFDDCFVSSNNIT